MRKIIIFISACFVMACSVKPVAIRIGKDSCAYCKMTISDRHFGAELLTHKGKIYIYDEASCMLNDMKERGIKSSDIQSMYLSNFNAPHSLMPVENTYLLSAETLRSPMGGNIAAFASVDSLQALRSRLGGTPITWKELNP